MDLKEILPEFQGFLRDRRLATRKTFPTMPCGQADSSGLRRKNRNVRRARMRYLDYNTDRAGGFRWITRRSETWATQAYLAVRRRRTG
jgi:hypothetical protein